MAAGSTRPPASSSASGTTTPASPVQLLFQVLDEEDGPVRAHLDHGTDDVPAEVRRVLDLGADDIGPGRGWHALRDPVGLAFCVTGNSPELTRRRDLG